jgi:hypothetical protein
VPDVAARRLGEDEAYVIVRDILSEASTVRPELTAEGGRRWRAITRAQWFLPVLVCNIRVKLEACKQKILRTVFR